MMRDRSVPAAARGIAVHVACAVGLAVGWWISRLVRSSSFVSEPVPVLSILVAAELPVVIIAYSLVRTDKERNSFLKAVGRGILGLPLGALLNAFGALVLGAPFWIEYIKRTVCWSLLMSLFTFVPAVCVFGCSRKDWQRILALSRTADALDFTVSLPAHGAVIGAWFGAWPMPLDWERPWQEWPVCVTYGGVIGYALGVLASLLLILMGLTVRQKND